MKKTVVALLVFSFFGWVGYKAFQGYQARAAMPATKGAGRVPAGPGGGFAAMRAPLVEAAQVEMSDFKDRVLLVGSLKPDAEVQVMSKISGRIEMILVDVGDPVGKGQLIAAVEDREILQQIQQAEAALGVARASIQQREAELANFERQVARFRELFEQDLIARQDLEDAATRQQSSQAQVLLSKAQLRQSEAALNQFKINHENTRIYAPMDGVVGRRHLHPGAIVSMNTPILTIVNLENMRTLVNVVEKDLVRISQGAHAEVAVDAFPGRTFDGRVSRVSPVLDPATRTAEVEVHLANPGWALRAEMFARVLLDLGGRRQGLLVPRDALIYRGDQGGVFVLQEGIARFRPIQSGIAQQDAVEVISGLSAGEQVITMGASLLKDGDRVRLREAEPRSDEAGS